MSNVAYIYHHDDPDGHTSAAIIYNMLKNSDSSRPDTITCIECDYDAAFDNHMQDDIDMDLYFVDLSFTDQTMHKLINACKNQHVKHVVWIDHHKSSKKYVDEIYDVLTETYKDLKVCTFFSTILSGAGLCYLYYCIDAPFQNCHKYLAIDNSSYHDPTEHFVTVHLQDQDRVIFNDRISIPDFIYHVDNYDRWTKQDPDADAFITGMKLNGYKIQDNDSLNTIFKDNPASWSTSRIIEIGKYCLDYQIQVYEEQKDMISLWSIGSKPIKVAFKTGHGNSWNFLNMLDSGEADVAFLVRWNPNTEKWLYSVYARDDHPIIDCSVIAEQFGGGGHKGAAGFSSSLFLFEHGVLWFCAILNTEFPEIAKMFTLDTVDDTEAKQQDYNRVAISGSDTFPETIIVDKTIFNTIKDAIPEDLYTMFIPSIDMNEEDKIERDKCKYKLYIFYPCDLDMSTIYDMTNDLRNDPDNTRVIFLYGKDQSTDTELKYDNNQQTFINRLMAQYGTVTCTPINDAGLEIGVFFGKVIADKQHNK